MDNFWLQGQFFWNVKIQKYFASNISFKIARIKSKSVKTLNLFFWNVGKINFPSEIQLIFTKKWSILWLNLIIEYYRILRSNTVFSRIYSILKSRFRMAPKYSNIRRIGGFRIFGYTTNSNMSNSVCMSPISQTAIKSFGATGQDLGIGLKSKFDPKLVA